MLKQIKEKGGDKRRKERDSDLTHPRHREFSDFAVPLLKDVLVFDYDTDELLI